MKGDSQRVQRARARDGASVMVYVALRQLFCEACGGFIEPGAQFTRKHMTGAGSRTLPHCRTCNPWEGA